MEWIKVFQSEDEAKKMIAPEHPRLVVLHGKKICLTFYDNKFFAVQDACSHQSASLSQGHLNYLGEIICPLHNYCFDMRSGEEALGRAPDLETFPIKIDESGFFVGI